MLYARSIVMILCMLSLCSVTFVTSSSALEPGVPSLDIEVNNGILINPEIPVPLNLSKAPVVSPEWSVKLTGRFQGEPIVAADGTIYVKVLADESSTELNLKQKPEPT